MLLNARCWLRSQIAKSHVLVDDVLPAMCFAMDLDTRNRRSASLPETNLFLHGQSQSRFRVRLKE